VCVCVCVFLCVCLLVRAVNENAMAASTFGPGQKGLHSTPNPYSPHLTPQHCLPLSLLNPLGQAMHSHFIFVRVMQSGGQSEGVNRKFAVGGHTYTRRKNERIQSKVQAIAVWALTPKLLHPSSLSFPKHRLFSQWISLGYVVSKFQPPMSNRLGCTMISPSVRIQTFIKLISLFIINTPFIKLITYLN